jgi:hypothetical protein
MTTYYKSVFFFVLILLGTLVNAQPWQQVGGDIDGDTLDYSGWSTSINANGSIVIIGAPYNDSTGVDAGRARIYQFDGSVWQQLGADIVGAAAGDKFGYSTSISNDGYTIAVGAPFNDGSSADAGHVRVYRFIASVWQQLGTDIEGSLSGDFAGSSISLSSDGNTVAIGANGNNFNSGYTKIYTFNGSAWQQVGGDIVAENIWDQAGFAVSLNSNGNTIAIGAPYNDGTGTSAGHVRIYSFSGSSWQQVGDDIDGEAANDLSGSSISLSSDGSTVVIGAPKNTQGVNTYAGHARVYYFDGSAWQQKGVEINGEAYNDRSGTSTSISGDGNTIAIGAPSNDANGSASGHVRVFTYNGNAWQQLGLDLDGEKAGDNSGFSSCISKDGYNVAIGAYGNDDNGPISGHVRVYDICIPTASTDSVQVCDSSFTWIDSVIYTASNNTATHLLVNARGCDSLVSLNLTINSSFNNTDVHYACESFTWIDSVVYTASNNTATQLLTSSGGCDSLVTLDLTIFNGNTGIDTRTECDSLIWIDGITYSANNNTATFTLSNVNGCDSLVTLDLSLINSSAAIDIQTACDTFVWIDGNTYTTNNNTATHILTNAVGCDSLVTLDLTISNSSYSTDVFTVCDSLTWIDGNTYISSNNTATFTIAGGAVNGCDSIVNLNLTVNSNTGTDVQIICDTIYTWIDGNTYISNNTTATHTLTNVAGCDSIVTLNLSINANVTGTDSIVACDTYTWIDGNTYNSSNTVGNYNYVGGAANGCDSLVLLNLTIINVDTSVTVFNPVLSSNATGVTYQWLDCDSNYSAITGATAPIFNPAVNGNYAVEITENSCVDTSACISITNVGIEDNYWFNNVSVFPNPNQGVVNVSLGKLKGVSIHIYSVTGQLIKQITNVNTPLYTIKLNEAPGIYFMEISTAGEKKRFKLVKN